LSFRSLLTLAGPGVLVLLPAAVWLSLAPDAPELARAASGYPYAALAVVALLAWRFQRSRVVAAAGALALAHVLLQSSAGAPPATHLAAALLAPALALVGAMADRRLGAARGALQVAVPFAAAAAGYAALLEPARVAGWMARPLVAPALTGWSSLPQAALAGEGLGLLVLAGLALRRGRALDAGLFWAALAGTAALAAPADSPARGLWMLAGALALGVALVEAAYALAFRDELTDLPGRRALGGLLASLRPTYSIAVVDVDRFKLFNDRYGHDVGDQVLRMVAARLGAVKGGGQAFRSGGEEFTIVFPGLTAEEAMPHLEAVRLAVADTKFVIRGRLRPRSEKGAAKRGRTSAAGKQLRVTVSIGVARCADRRTTADQVVKSADKAMYRAKQSGRNRVVA
jgi:diguanylate cyclase (GGDEF)-like protein